MHQREYSESGLKCDGASVLKQGWEPLLQRLKFMLGNWKAAALLPVRKP